MESMVLVNILKKINTRVTNSATIAPIIRNTLETKRLTALIASALFCIVTTDHEAEVPGRIIGSKPM
jgi:hypothetical protein